MTSEYKIGFLEGEIQEGYFIKQVDNAYKYEKLLRRYNNVMNIAVRLFSVPNPIERAISWLGNFTNRTQSTEMNSRLLQLPSDLLRKILLAGDLNAKELLTLLLTCKTIFRFIPEAARAVEQRMRHHKSLARCEEID